MRSGRWKRRTAMGLGLSLLMLVGADQLLLHTVMSDGFFQGHQLAPHDPPLFGDFARQRLHEYEELLQNDREEFDRETHFDPDLGWCPKPRGHHDSEWFDWAGSRIDATPLPQEIAEDETLIALVGCSFTLGSEVQGDETWAAVLDRKLPKVHVANFGFGGFGIDQALLRYRRDAAPLEPDEVWLGYFPRASVRVTSQLPQLYYRRGCRIIYFKPRFTVDDQGHLTLHPSPAKRPEDLPRLLTDQRAFLDAIGENDSWIRRVPAAYAPLGTHWTHHSALTRLWITLQDERRPPDQAMLSDPSSELYRLNRAIVLQLAREVEATGARFRLVLTPGWAEIAQARWGRWSSWALLFEELRREGIAILDPIDFLVEKGVNKAEVFWMPEGHPAPKTHEWIAEAILAEWPPG